LALKAAADALDRNPETAKIQKTETKSMHATLDAKTIGELMARGRAFEKEIEARVIPEIGDGDDDQGAN